MSGGTVGMDEDVSVSLRGLSGSAILSSARRTGAPVKKRRRIFVASTVQSLKSASLMSVMMLTPWLSEQGSLFQAHSK